MNSFFSHRVCGIKQLLLLIVLITTSAAIFAQKIEFTPEEKEWIKNHPVIYHGYEPNWPPYEMYNNGDYKGIIGDYVKILERETGIEIKPVPNITWKETVEGLKSGEIDFTVCAGITDERKQYLNFTKPYISSPMVIVTQKEGVFVSGLDGLRGKTISLPTQYYTVELIAKDYPDIKIIEKQSIEDCIRSVSMGETDAFVGNLVVASYYIEHLGFTNLKIAAPTDYDKTHIGLAARKDWPELISISQKVFDNISFQEKNDILQKWVAVRYEYGVNMAKIKTYVFYALIAIILLFALVLLWNKSLKREIKKRKKIEKQLEETLLKTNRKSEERKVLLQEIHHRVKNNLQIIISLLRLQQNDDEYLTKKLNETINRINAISLVHEKVYQSENVANIKLTDYVRSLAEDIINSFSDHHPKLIIESNIDEVNLKPLIPLALILNELITNSLKYGLINLTDGQISIKINHEVDKTTLHYTDNGKWIEPKKESSFGLSLIEIFTEQLDGSYTRTIEKGTTYYFTFNQVLK